MLLIILVCLLIAGSISTIALTHRPRVLWTDLASLVTQPPAASAIAGNFTTLPPGATLPDEQECAARVHRSSWEPRPDNRTANQSVPSEEQLALLTPWDESIGVDPQAKSPYNYALQLTQGTKYTKDFTVTEQGYTEGTDDPFGIANNANSPANILSDSLADAFSRINSLPAIGTSGTSKLLGMIYSGSF